MYITDTILQNLINFLAPVVGIAIILFCVIKAFNIFRGNEGSSIKSLILGLMLLLFILGIMYTAGSFDKYGNLFKGITDNVITNAADNADSIIGNGVE